MIKKISFTEVARDLIPFGREKDNRASKKIIAPTSGNNEEGMGEIAKQFGGDLTSKEAFEAYKNREVAINTQANFLRTVDGYMNLITTSLGGMAIGLLALMTPLKALIPGAVQTLTSIGGTASIMAFFVPIAIAAVVCGVAALAIGQYATRLETERNTDNTDFYTRRGAQVGARLAAPIHAEIQAPAIAKAIVSELQHNTKATTDRPLEEPEEPHHRDKIWAETVQHRDAAASAPKAKTESWEQVLEAAENTAPTTSQRIH